VIHQGDEVSEDIRLSAEVAVVGSGAGGATIAKELSEAGRKVVVLEAGRHFTREDFNLRMDYAFINMYWYGGQVMTLGSPAFMLPQGKTVGGTTTINSGTCFRMPHRVLKRWHLDHGLWEITAEELELYYGAVEEYLFVQKGDPEVMGRNAHLFLEGARKMGLSGGILARNAKDCEGYGVCCFGCPSDAKQSANVSYIPDAVRAGCEVYTGCLVEEIVVRGGRAAGVRGRFPRGGRKSPPGPRIEVEADVVVLAAGSLHTPRLLQVQGLCNSSGQVGRNLTIHPCSGTVAIMPEKLGNPKGIPQATYVDEFADDGIMLEGGTTPPLGIAMGAPYKGRRLAEFMSQYQNFGIFGGMLSEHCSTGKVIPHPRDRSRHLIFYSLKGEDVKKFKFMTELMAEIWFSLGAKSVITPTMSFPEMRPSELADFRRLKARASDYAAASAYHPLGTCRMGGGPESSVVRHTGETWEVENLFICDGSVVPTSLGVNPQMTIFALAMRCAGFVDDRLKTTAGRLPDRTSGKHGH
jgi:choline dehydrogenase-like flavoprotein